MFTVMIKPLKHIETLFLKFEFFFSLTRLVLDTSRTVGSTKKFVRITSGFESIRHSIAFSDFAIF
jgi:hypothetical protein